MVALRLIFAAPTESQTEIAPIFCCRYWTDCKEEHSPRIPVFDHTRIETALATVNALLIPLRLRCWRSVQRCWLGCCIQSLDPVPPWATLASKIGT